MPNNNKKSKSKKKKGQRNRRRVEKESQQSGVTIASGSTTSNTSAESSRAAAKVTPKHGWAEEVKQAESAIEREPNNGNHIMRLARAYHTMRKWEDLEEFISSSLLISLSLEEGRNRLLNSECREQLDTWLKEAQTQLKVDSLYGKGIRIFSKKVLRNIDTENAECGHPHYPNLNPLQCAAVEGDILALEKIVSFGAAIDFPVQRSHSKPKGTTPLFLACAPLAMVKLVQRRFGKVPQMKQQLKKCLECAMQLVRLGANCDIKLHLPSYDGNLDSEVKFYRDCGFDNKSPRDLAHISENQELIQLMELFKSEENAKNLVHCRCGSRLPWRECHAALGEAPHYMKEPGSAGPKLHWRLSPHANCFCKNAKKSYYRCCWKDDKAMYQDDTIGKLRQLPTIFISNEENKDFFESLRYLKNLPKEAKERMRESDVRDMLLSMSEKTWIEALDFNDPDKISNVRGMDKNAYVKIMKQMEEDQFFYWTDLHYWIPKGELLSRTDEWNTALEQYCDSEGFSGTERQHVIERHKASALARCANPDCKKFETRVKEFHKCVACGRVAYCSKDCQRVHWKTSYKRRCVPVKAALPSIFT